MCAKVYKEECFYNITCNEELLGPFTCLSNGGRAKELCNSYSIKYYLAYKKKEANFHVQSWRNFQDILLSEKVKFQCIEYNPLLW